MKTLITFATLLLTLSSLKAQQLSYGMFDLGYSTQSTNLLPVFAFGFGHKFCKESYLVTPVGEIGIRAHMDQQSAHNIYGHLSAGLQVNNFLAVTAGGIYGGNQQKQDRHVMQDTTIVLGAGAKREQYLSYQVALRGMVTVMKTDDERPALQLTAQITNAHNVWYGSIGIKFILND